MNKIMLSTSIWGAHHLHTFLNFTWPSLMAPGNLPALVKQRKVLVNIYVDKMAHALLPEKIPMPRGVEFSFNPLEIFGQVDKYKLLGQMQNIDLQNAKKYGFAYHCLMPDFVYSENCFAGMLAAIDRGHKAIARLVMSTTQEAICPALEKYRYDGALLIPHIDLATLGLLNIHPGCKNWLAQPEGYPDVHVQAYETPDTLRMLSPHLSPVYLAHEAIKLPVEILPFDCQLDKLTNSPWYCPKAADGIGMIEISPSAARTENNTRGTVQEFARMFRVNTRHSLRQKNLFFEETVDPINRKLLWPRAYFDHAQIERKKIIINDALFDFSAPAAAHA